MTTLSSTHIELFTYFIYLYLILFHFINFKKLTYTILILSFLIIYFGTLTMFPIWQCKISFFYNYGYIFSFFYSLSLVAFLYFINLFHKKLKNNLLYISSLLLIPFFYYFMIKTVQHFYNCESSFFKTYSPFYYFFVIFIMFIPIIKNLF